MAKILKTTKAPKPKTPKVIKRIAAAKKKRVTRVRALALAQRAPRSTQTASPAWPTGGKIATRRAPPPIKLPAEIPPILLEGDTSPPPPVSGPGARYALSPTSHSALPGAEPTLPSAYGTRHLLLTARDPHWLYAHWDLTDEQQREYNSLSADRHLVLRVQADAAPGTRATEIHVHPESRHWFIHVERAGTKYVAELGYYQADRKWVTISTSTATVTPPDQVSPETTAEFSAMPFEPPFAKLLSLVKEAVRENAPLAEELRDLRGHGHPDLPPAPSVAAPHLSPASVPAIEPQRPTKTHPIAPPHSPATKPVGTARPPVSAEWTPAQERALAEVISMDHVRRVWMGSLEITELIRRQYFQELASQAAAGLGGAGLAAPTSPTEALGGISSPQAGAPSASAPAAKGFWFNVNAELIIYGATEADAAVTIGGRPIKLRPDGSFSYRFSLPDGQYELPIVAISADQTDRRAAVLRFSRGTEHRGDVGAHPQDHALKPPVPGSV